jgi:hypothetical protein
MPKQIPSVSERPAGKIPSTNVTNELARAVQAMAPSIAGGQIPLDSRLDYFWAVVVDEGPDNPNNGDSPEADYTDERYWVRRSFIDGIDSLTDDPATPRTHITTSYENDEDNQPVLLTASNIAEMYLDVEAGGIEAYQSGTHLLPVGTRVFVFYAVDAGGDPQNIRYFFVRPVQPRVLIAANATCGGVYQAKFVKGATDDFDPEASTFDTSDIGAVADAFDCYAVNLAEKGLTTHYLTAGTPTVFTGTLRSRKSEDDYHVVILNGMNYAPCVITP